LFAEGNGSPDPAVALPAGSPNAGTATYTLRFSQPGTYTLYYRWRASADAAVQTTGFQGNSIYLPASFGAAPTITSSSNGIGVNSTPPSTSYNALADATTYTVSAAQVGTDLAFTIQTREMAMYIDRFIFSTDPIDVTGGSTTAFDALSNSPVVPVPEPGSLGLVLAAAAGAGVARRRIGARAPALAPEGR
jgi:hypothetical protein